MNTCSGLVWFIKQISLWRPSDAEASNGCRNLRTRYGARTEVRSLFPAATGVYPVVRPPVHTEAMMVRISKTLVAGISALAMASGVVLPAAPRAAGGVGGGGCRRGGGARRPVRW